MIGEVVPREIDRHRLAYEPLASNMTLLDYERSDALTRRPLVAWLPLVCVAIVLTTPYVFGWTASDGYVEAMHDFGVKMTRRSMDSLAFVNWLAVGPGRFLSAIVLLAAGFVTPHVSRQLSRPTRSTIAIALLSAVCVSLIFYLTLSRLIEVDGWEGFNQVMRGISGRGATLP